jgi:hypothetical protein
MIVFPKIATAEHQPGDYVTVRVNSATSATLLGEIAE